MISPVLPMMHSPPISPTQDSQISTSLLLPAFDSVAPKKPWSGIAYPYRSQLTSTDSSRLALYSRIPPYTSIPRKRTMQAPSEQTSCAHPVSIPSPTLSRCSDSLSPCRDSFFPSPGKGAQTANDPAQNQFLSYHRYQNSASTSASVSTNSSPTTSSSMMDSAAAETPGTSPDTPASFQSYSCLSLSMAIRTGHEQKTDLRPVPAPFSKKPRNLKNLAVNTTSTFNPIRAVSTASFPLAPPRSPTAPPSASLSPTFVLPANPPRRRPGGPGGLTIQTPATGTFPLQQLHPTIPSTPGLSSPTTFKTFQNVPSFPMPSAGFPPEGGMRLPSFSSNRSNPPSAIEEENQVSATSASAYDLPQSQEAKPDAYPHGPICIYDPHVYLYFEPTAEEASNYDVIFNVASEVENPFCKAGRSDVKPVDLKAAVRALAEPPSSPSTPRPGMPNTETAVEAVDKRPEYIHVPWEHNTDIVPGTGAIPPLHDIIRIIDSRVKSGKRVLIHCQCGVSRSASLIVAYGLYKNPSITVQEAYDAVKKRSEWIGPNMNLIMQLQEFRNVLRLGTERLTQTQQTHQKSAARLHGRGVPTTGNEADAQNIPQTAPLPQNSPKLAPPPLITQNLQDVSPGPSSAPSDFHWPSSAQSERLTPSNNATPTANNVSMIDATVELASSKTPTATDNPVKTKKAALAIRTDIEYQSSITIHKDVVLPDAPSGPSLDGLASPRNAEFAMAPLRAKEPDDMGGLSSPRPIELSQSPLFNPPPQTAPVLVPQPVSSPRSAEFAMTPVQQPAVDHSFGLTSPRTSTFTTLLPHRPPQDDGPKVGALQPPPATNIANAQARAELRSHLGFNSTRSHNNIHSAFVQAEPPRAKSVTPLAVAPEEPLSMAQSDFADALMSPRATEFTSNPFHDASADVSMNLGNGEIATNGVTKVASDPRSPPLKGGSPIVRSIFDVLQ